MTCSYCSFEFDLVSSRHACGACAALGGGCKSVRCPRCHYDMPEPLELPPKFRAFLQKMGLIPTPKEHSDADRV